jgi:hypothetical protein
MLQMLQIVQKQIQEITTQISEQNKLLHVLTSKKETEQLQISRPTDIYFNPTQLKELFTVRVKTKKWPRDSLFLNGERIKRYLQDDDLKDVDISAWLVIDKELPSYLLSILSFSVFISFSKTTFVTPTFSEIATVGYIVMKPFNIQDHHIYQGFNLDANCIRRLEVLQSHLFKQIQDTIHLVLDENDLR